MSAPKGTDTKDKIQQGNVPDNGYILDGTANGSLESQVI